MCIVHTHTAGVAYINHPEYVASLVTTDEEKATAYLHDTLEDTSLTVEQLKNAKIPTAVIEAVSVLTKNGNDDYFCYLGKVKNNPIARKVKLADLQHNSDLTRLNHLEKKDMDRLVKYKKAQKFLNEI
ncbi:GTP pyrophosphokinase [Enterococcus faecalis]|nr:GTP pyrophosphokinase [Enterococcus faecalis]